MDGAIESMATLVSLVVAWNSERKRYQSDLAQDAASQQADFVDWLERHRFEELKELVLESGFQVHQSLNELREDHIQLLQGQTRILESQQNATHLLQVLCNTFGYDDIEERDLCAQSMILLQFMRENQAVLDYSLDDYAIAPYFRFRSTKSEVDGPAGWPEKPIFIDEYLEELERKGLVDRLRGDYHADQTYELTPDADSYDQSGSDEPSFGPPDLSSLAVQVISEAVQSDHAGFNTMFTGSFQLLCSVSTAFCGETVKIGDGREFRKAFEELEQTGLVQYVQPSGDCELYRLTRKAFACFRGNSDLR